MRQLFVKPFQLKLVLTSTLALFVCLPVQTLATETVVINGQTLSAQEVVKSALDRWRGKSSYAEVTMQIHRPDWQRTMSMKSWTQGLDKSLIRFTSPAKDAGNATLKRDQDMWIFTPKLQRVTKLPTSMMTQSWMGSDFSYNDLAKSDQILTQYHADINQVLQIDNYQVLTLTLIPKANAPIVWGKEELQIRSDFVLLQQTFYDQEMRAVKSMKTLKIEQTENRPYPSVMRMVRLDKPEQWTQIETTKMQFDMNLPNTLFTLSNLKSPRNWVDTE